MRTRGSISLIVPDRSLLSAQNRTNDQNLPYNRFLFLMTATSLPTLYNLFYSMGAASERDRVKREVNNGMYSVMLYVLATSLVALPVAMNAGLVSTMFSYIWGDFHSWGSVGYVILLIGAANYWMSAIAQFCGWVCGITGGPQVYTLIWAISCGRLRHPLRHPLLAWLASLSWPIALASPHAPPHPPARARVLHLHPASPHCTASLATIGPLSCAAAALARRLPVCL